MSNRIKQLAAGIMAVDHIGFIANALILRIIGRISFPLFAYQFGQTWKLTSNKKKLSNRLLIMGLISQVPYTLMTNRNNINMMLGFWVILEILKLVHKCKPKYKLIALIAGAIGCELARIDYGWYSPTITILLMSYTSHPVWWISWTLVNFTYTAWTGWWPQIFAIAAPAVLILYQPAKESKPPLQLEKSFYYWFYPTHMAVLAIIKAFIVTTGDSL